MTEVLFLAHRIPFPPNKGDKIRSYNLLRTLSARCTVHLGAFVDDADDWKHAESLRPCCAEFKLVPLRRVPAAARAVLALGGAEPLTVLMYRSAEMQRWVDRILQSRPISTVVVFSSAMARFLRGSEFAGRTIVDFVDVDSDKWAQYARKARGPLAWLYRREARTLLQFEREVAAGAAASVFVSDAEATLFRTLAPESSARIVSSRNGVDVGYFNPAESFENPYPSGIAAILFSGAMDYRANVDAVDWFAREIFARVRAEIPRAEFYIVGSRPARAVQALAGLEGVTVTGSVPDMRPYLAHAKVAIAPLRTARGVQNKVLEALAMNCPVVATSAAARGLDDAEVPGLVSADGETEFARAVVTQLRDVRGRGDARREYICKRYDWSTNLAGFLALALGEGTSRLAIGGGAR